MSGPGSRKNNLPKQLLLAHAMESAFDDNTKDEGTASSEDPPKENRIGGRGAPCPLKFPKVWALAALKYFDERFDQTLTGNCDSEELLRDCARRGLRGLRCTCPFMTIEAVPVPYCPGPGIIRLAGTSKGPGGRRARENLMPAVSGLRCGVTS